MANFHTNPKTGISSPCGVDWDNPKSKGCPFGSREDHADTLAGARSNYELKMKVSDSSYMQSVSAASTSAKSKLFAGSQARALLGDLTGKDYQTVVNNAKDRASLAVDYFKTVRTSNSAGPKVLDVYTIPAPDDTSASFHYAVDARRNSLKHSKAFANSSVVASASVASDTRAALGARQSRSNPFLRAARSLIS